MAFAVFALVLFEVADLMTGESAKVNGATVKLIGIEEQRDPIERAVRTAWARVEVDKQAITLACGNYELPRTVGNYQVDCTVTGAYRANTTTDHWGLVKDARIRVWKKGSPFIEPGVFTYPARQRWFVSQTQMSNEPTHVDRGERSSRQKVYYHSGLDIGGAEALTEVVAATDGQIVSLGNDVLEGHAKDTPVAKRYDVIYLLDERGWYYRYSHLHSFDSKLKLGDKVMKGQRLGLLGKEGGSGGWSHLHFEIVSRQPSGKWGTQEGYAFLWEAYLREHQPKVAAVARPHRFAVPGEKVVLDGSRSYNVATYEWNGTPGVKLEKSYDKPGSYIETLKVKDRAGNVSYDFTSINVLDPRDPNADPLTIHAVYWPSESVKAGQELTFKVRTFGSTEGEELWEFGDGSSATSKSDGNQRMHAKDGYAIVKHTYSRAGDYIVRVWRGNAETRLWVPVR